jgi:hypothetical protein
MNVRNTCIDPFAHRGDSHCGSDCQRHYPSSRWLPVVGLAFVWNTIRDCDMATIGTTTPDEARESIAISLGLLNRRIPEHELQKTRSKNSLC